jgi:hypothetical protein
MNTGSVPMNVRQIKAPCSCSSATIDRKTLKSQESAAVNVVFDTRGWYDQVKKEILVETDSTVNPLIILRLEGMVKFPLEPKAPSIHFDYRKGEDFKIEHLTVIASGIARGSTLRVRGETVPKYLQVDVKSNSQDIYIVSLRLNVRQAPARFVTQVQLVTDVKNSGAYLITVNGLLMQGLRSIPDVAYFGVIDRGASCERVLTVVSPDPQESVRAEDLAVTMNAHGATADVIAVTQKSRTVEVSVRLTPINGSGVVTGVLSINQGEKARLDVPIKGYVRQ